MKQQLQRVLGIAMLLFSSFITVSAQEALSYLESASLSQKDISQRYMSYVSAVSHGKSARKVEKRRISLLETVQQARNQAEILPPFKGDRALKDALVSYLGIMFNILNEDYGKIVNLEDIAEQSYDNMEAYFMAQDMANKKQDIAYKKYESIYEDFAKKNNITLVSKESELSLKLKQANVVNSYYHALYLMFFKSYKQDFYLSDAINKSNVSGIEQNKNTLVKYANETITKLDTMKAFEDDRTLIMACRDLMQFYVEEGSKMQIYTDFLLKNENFAKMSKAFNSKSDRQRTQADVDTYNKEVNEINALTNTYNKTNQEINNKRAKYINGWNDAVSRFLDNHVPKYK